jgi:catechol 2,3-dioxygenase-like lactoylglutathione lyase family enzyme
MSLLGVESLIYGVDDLAICTRFYADFGLEALAKDAASTHFRLPEGSHVRLYARGDPRLPAPFLTEAGPAEIVWGVDSQRSLDTLVADLRRDRSVQLDDAGTAHCRDDAGMSIGLRLFERHAPASVDAPGENNLGQIGRWNRHRKWYERARPKQINHVVFGVPDVDRAVEFYTGRLGFRVTDIMRGFGMFMRCDGRHDHHNLFLMKMPKLFFSHVSFGVESIDELMVGANDMRRAGWTSEVGLGRHRISSLLFYYLSSPAGGQTEYSADSDYLTDEWRPRLWEAEFGHYHWLAAPPPAARIARHGEAPVLEGALPKLSATAGPPAPAASGEQRS